MFQCFLILVVLLTDFEIYPVIPVSLHLMQLVNRGAFSAFLWFYTYHKLMPLYVGVQGVSVSETEPLCS